MTGSAEDYLRSGINVRGRTLLDAGCGLGSSTLMLASAVAHEGHDTRVIAVDRDAQDIEYAKAQAVAFGLSHLIHFVHADLSDLSTLASGSVDHVVIVNTLGWLEETPLGTVSALVRLSEVLTAGGGLSVLDQLPCAPEGRTAWDEAWELQKLLHVLRGEPHMRELRPAMVEKLLQALGYRLLGREEFEPEALPGAAVHGFLDRLTRRSDGLPGPERQVMLSRIQRVSDRVQDAEAGPRQYVIHAVRDCPCPTSRAASDQSVPQPGA